MMNSLSGQSLFKHISEGDLNAVNNLLRNGIVNLDERDQDGQTFLMIACQLGDSQIVKRLLEETTVDVNAIDNDCWTALLNAAKQGSVEVTKCLLAAKADIEHRDIAGWTALMWACYKGRTDVAKLLLSNEANPNVKGEHHMSCLTWAAGRGHVEIVKELLHYGAKVSTADKYGTTPLIWACRKGHVEIVDMLLAAGAVVDKAGMNSWTALIVATSGDHIDVVQSLLARHPNVNAVDKDGLTALSIAAKEGFGEIVGLLLQHDAYVNLPDRYGDTILIHAVKGNHIEIARALLKKYADVDVQGVDGKTALYWAVDKGLYAIAKTLLDFNANMELATKDGDTPLLRAARCRNYDLVQLLVEKGAKVSTADRRGDNPLHVAVRGRSKRITDYLLRNPKNAKLLYSKNKAGETPYQIDAGFDRSVLSQVFAARNLNADNTVQGYEVYSSTIADVLSEPSLHTPITVGLFARWGSGKSYLIAPLRKEMEAFAERNMDTLFEFSWLQFIVCFLVSVLLGVSLGVAFEWYIGLAVGGGIFILLYCFLGVVWYGSNRKEWDAAIHISVYLAQKFQFLGLFLQLIFCNEPEQKHRETAGIRFLFTNNARMTSLVGDKFISGMIGTLCDALEAEYGILVPRLYRIFKPLKASDHGRFKSLCCVPYFLIAILVLMCIIASLVLMAVFGFHAFNDSTTGVNYTIVNSVLIALGAIVSIALLANVYTWLRAIAHLAVPTRKQVEKISRNLDSIKIDGFVQLLKKEVEALSNMTRCMDAFTNSHTRLVIIVDGLDSCEQDKLLQVLDMVHVLFGGNNDAGSPFITLLAFDPHIVIRGIEHNIHSHFRDSSINGHDYLRTIVQLPFFIQSQALPRLQAPPPPRNHSTTRADQLAVNDLSGPVTTHRQESYVTGASYLSLTELGKGGSSGPGKGGRRLKSSSTSGGGPSANGVFGSTTLVRQASHFDLSKSIGKSSYFSDINPRSMKRLMNILGVTGRLLRAYNIDFNWYKLASWINITEQWPYRLSWIILEVEDNPEIEDVHTLKIVYDRVSSKIPVSRDVDPLVEIDRNVRKLEVFLANSQPSLTVADMRRFLPCTVNIDPYLRKLIRDLQQNTDIAAMAAGEHSYYVNGGTSSMDAFGMLSPCGGSMRRSQAQHSQPMGSRSMLQRPVNMPPGPIPYGMNPMMMYPPAASPQMVMYHPMTQTTTMPGYDEHQQHLLQPQLQSAVSVPPASVKRPRYLVDVEGDVCKKPLSKMSIDDIVNLVGCISGLNRRFLPDYNKRLMDNNINGMVLTSCSLNELKPVLRMTFGDWELLRAVIEWLRYRDLHETDAGASESDVSDVPIQKDLRQIAAASDATLLKQSNQLPPAATCSLPGLASKTPSSTVGDGSHPPAARSTSAAKPSRPTTRDDHTDGSSQSAAQSPSSGPLKPLNRTDSFVKEVLMESEALRGVIQASGVGSDSDAESPGDDNETQRIISPIPEEPVTMSRNSSIVSFNMNARVVTLSRQVSQENLSTSPGDKTFFIGPDNDSGESDSDEVERLARKSSVIVRKKGASPRSSVQTDAIKLETETVARDPVPTSGDKRKSSMKSTKPPPEHPPSRKSSIGKQSDVKSKQTSKTALSERKSDSTMPLMSAYFPMAFESSSERNVPGERSHVTKHSVASSLPPDAVGSHMGDSQSGRQDVRPSSATSVNMLQSAGSDVLPQCGWAGPVMSEPPSAPIPIPVVLPASVPEIMSTSADSVRFFIAEDVDCPRSTSDVVVELETLQTSPEVAFVTRTNNLPEMFL